MFSPLHQDSGQTPEERADEAMRLLEMVKDDTDQMAQNEQRFVADLQERFEKYGIKTLVSAKQLFWLRDIKDRLL